jgi:hypothetical protein
LHQQQQQQQQQHQQQLQQQQQQQQEQQQQQHQHHQQQQQYQHQGLGLGLGLGLGGLVGLGLQQHDTQDLHSSSKQDHLITAWSFVVNPTKHTDPEAIKEILRDVGMAEPYELEYCSTDVILQLASHMKAIPRKGFLQLLQQQEEI